jgi:hypothetical protein
MVVLPGRGCTPLKHSWTWLALGAALLMGLLAAACGDGGGDALTDAPTSTPTPPPLEETLPLDRFRYAATLSLRERGPASEAREVAIATEGTFQSPDRHAFTYSTRWGEGSLTESAVIIGDQVWLRAGDGAWHAADEADQRTTELLGSAYTSFEPNFLSGAQFDEVRSNVRRLPSAAEMVNGVLTNHYQVGQAGLAFLEAFLGADGLSQDVEDLSWELWLAEDGGWPVRLLAKATITSDLKVLEELNLRAPTTWVLRIDVSQPNDPALTVLAPDQD